MAQKTSAAAAAREATRNAPHGSDERFRLLVDSVADHAIVILDLAGHVVSWNIGAERLKGYSAGEIIGKHFSRFFPADDVAAGKPERELEQARASGRVEDEGWRVRKDGALFWANVVITALLDDDHTLVGFAKVTRDLTERRRAEQDRVRRAAMEEALRLRDQFVAATSHELRTPLSTLRLQVDGLLRNVEQGRESLSTDRAARRLATMQTQVDRLQRLVDELLDHSRIDAGVRCLRREEVDLTSLAREAVERFSERVAQSGGTVHFDGDAVVTGWWDRERIDQAITNLLENAALYGLDGAIEVSVRGNDTHAVFTVRDHGIGIAPEEHARVFQRFERAVDDRHFAGLGLGLWHARQIVEQHGGTIAVASELGKGATFTVELPRGKK